MTYNLKNPYEVKELYKSLEHLVEKGVTIELKRKSPLRSLKQNSYLHLILGFFASEYGISLEEAKVDFFKRECNREIFEREVYNKSGKRVGCLRSTAELTTAELTLAIDRFRNYSSAVAGIYLPAPNEEQFLAFCAQEIEKNKEYV